MRTRISVYAGVAAAGGLAVVVMGCGSGLVLSLDDLGLGQVERPCRTCPGTVVIEDRVYVESAGLFGSGWLFGDDYYDVGYGTYDYGPSYSYGGAYDDGYYSDYGAPTYYDDYGYYDDYYYDGGYYYDAGYWGDDYGDASWYDDDDWWWW